MTEPIKKTELYNDGICQCTAAMKGKHITFNKALHASHHFTVYMCIKCDKPIYWQSMPYR